VAILAAAACGVTAADAKDPTVGKWRLESVVRDGKPDDSLKGATRTHDADGKYTITPVGGDTMIGTYTLDATHSPVTIDMKPAGGRYKDKTLLGIAKLEGDTLTVCFAEPGKDRPAKFESAPGSGLVLAVHKKVK
jgi:uncharacterized protein (TIGR03067 family)